MLLNLEKAKKEKQTNYRQDIPKNLNVTHFLAVI